MNKPPPPKNLEDAKAFVRDYIRSIAPQSLVDEHALRICGEPPERVEQILRDLRHELADGMASCNPAPPRPFLGPAAMGAEKQIHEIAQREVAKAFEGGKNYHELSQILHAAEKAWHATKDLVESIGEDEDEK